jgi:hypothetical protein
MTNQAATVSILEVQKFVRAELDEINRDIGKMTLEAGSYEIASRLQVVASLARAVHLIRMPPYVESGKRDSSHGHDLALFVNRVLAGKEDVALKASQPFDALKFIEVVTK